MESQVVFHKLGGFGSGLSVQAVLLWIQFSSDIFVVVVVAGY